MAEVGSAFVSVIPSAKGFGKTLDSQVGGDIDGSGKRMGSRFGTAMKVGALAVVAGGALVGKVLKGAVDDASDLAEATSKVGVVFGKSAGQIITASKSAATSMGLTKGAYLEATGTLGNLLVSLDIAPKKAAGMSQGMVKLAADMASFNNVPVEDALLAIRSGLVGETEPLRRFGVNMNDATLKAQAMKMGLIKTTKDALTPQAKALAAQALIMKQTGTAQGDFARTSGGLANQQKILGAQFGNLKTTIGTALLPVVTRLVTFLNGLGPAFGRVGGYIAPAVASVKAFVTGMQNGTGAGGVFAGVMSTIGNAVMVVGGFLARNLAAFAAFVGIIGTAVVVGRAYAIVQGLINVVMAANPIGLVVVAIAALVAGLIYAYKHSETFRNIVNAAFNAVRNVVAKVIGWLGKWVPGVFARVVSLVKGYVNIYKTVVTTAFKVVKAVVTVAVNATKAAVSAAFNAIKAVITTARAVISAAMSAVRTAFNLVKTAVGTMASTVKNKVGDAIGFLKSIPGKAKAALGNLGGILVGAGQALVQGLINGITSKIAALGNKIRELAGMVRGAFGGSPVEWGPLKSWNNTGPTGPGGQLVGRLISSIDSQGPALEASMTRLSSRISVPRLALDASVGASGRAGAAHGALVNIEQMITHDPAEAAYRLRVEQGRALTLAGLP